jgi:hypothetical protein
MMGGLTHVRNRAPFLGGMKNMIEHLLGSFAMWGGCFSVCDCLLIYYRQKDDPFNAIAAGAVTGGVLAIRGKENHVKLRWTKCGIQKCNDWRSYLGFNRRNFNHYHLNLNEKTTSNDGADA